MRVVVTGGTGFVGGYVVSQLIARDHEVTLLVRSPESFRHPAAEFVSLVQGDVCVPDGLARAFAGHDCLIHLANVYSFWEQDCSVYERVNVQGTRNVMEAALRTRLPKVVHVSTLAVWGDTPDRPFTEQSPPGRRRFSRYAESKYQGDLIAWELYEQQRLPLVVVYPGPCIGSDDPKGTGQYVRDLASGRLPARICEDSKLTLVRVEDVADAIILAMEKDGNIGERYLIGKETCTVKELNLFVSALAHRSPPRFALPRFLTTTLACLATNAARVTRRPPCWGLATDQVRTMQEGFYFDGSKAERELGLRYRPVGDAIAGIVRNLPD
ncbi:MAG: NAD-dependent epimerase/dehydratase family protein [Thermoleophilia bacterium]